MALGEIPNQSFHVERVPSGNCVACADIVDLILHAHQGVSPRQANKSALKEFETMMDDKLCREDLVCLPLCRLRNRK